LSREWGLGCTIQRTPVSEAHCCFSDRPNEWQLIETDTAQPSLVRSGSKLYKDVRVIIRWVTSLQLIDTATEPFLQKYEREGLHGSGIKLESMLLGPHASLSGARERH
jgi:hypothetical protein